MKMKSSIYSRLACQIIFSFFCLKLMAMSPPVNMRCCDHANPVGVDQQPYFGWFNSGSDNQKQTSYQVLIATDVDKLNEASADIWNSGAVKESTQNYIYYTGGALKSGTQYYWKVRVWDADKEASAYSEVGTFSTGLFSDPDWEGAKWIKRKNNDKEDYTYFRRKFAVEAKAVKRVTAYITAVHDYELYLNGTLVGKGPGYNYPQYQYYNAFDITEAVKSGKENLFACLTHWYGGGQGRPKSAKGLLVKAVVEYTDGTQQVVVTDKRWKQKQVTAFTTGQPRRNGEGIGFVDKIDARNSIADWHALSYDDAAWDAADEIGSHPVKPWTGKMQPNLAQLIEEEITPVSVTSNGNGQYIIDLGKVYAGVPKITFKGGVSGTEIKILGGYTLDNGLVSTETDQSTDMSYFFILNGETAVFQPFVYLGMRYLQVDNSPNELTKSNVKFITRHYELDPAKASFKSSNQMLNNVWDLMTHSLVVGAQESFVDTPTREKGGFLGDSWSVGSSAMTTMGERVMNLRILKEFLQSQEQYWPDGRMNAVYPNVDGGRDIPDYTQMFLFWVWDYYMQTGNKMFLRTYFDQIKKVVEYVNAYKDERTGLIHNLAGGSNAYLHGIIDWPTCMRYGYDMKTESRTVMNAYAYLDFKLMAQIAEELDSTAVQKTYLKMAEAMKEAINDKLINSDGVYIDGLKDSVTQSSHASQHANMIPLALGIVPKDNKGAVTNLVKDQKMSVGMITVRWLPTAIGTAEEGEHLIDLYTNTNWDGWAKTVAAGGTTTWESWDALELGESMSHPWGAVGVWGIQEYILGVKALKPQHELVQVKPLWFGDKLLQAEGSMPTDRGDISVSWRKTDATYTMTVVVPENVSAKVYLPKGESGGKKVTVNGKTQKGKSVDKYLYIGEYGSGKYTFVRTLK